MANAFQVLVHGIEFHLSLAQVQQDSPNAFTEHFRPSEVHADQLQAPFVLDSDPDLFAIIVQYLSGYDILPLAPTAVPRTLSLDAAKKGLLRDAGHLGLSGLHSILHATTVSHNAFLHWSGTASNSITLLDFLEGRNPPGSRRSDRDFADRSGRDILISTRGGGIRYVACEPYTSCYERNADLLILSFTSLLEALPLVNPRPAALNSLIDPKRPVFRIELYEHPPLHEIMTYGQLSVDARLVIDGRSVDPDQVPMGVPMMIEEAWLSFTVSWLRDLKTIRNARGYHLKLLSIKARTRVDVIASLELDYGLATALDSDEVTLAG
jgi:hypothetical protein